MKKFFISLVFLFAGMICVQAHPAGSASLSTASNAAVVSTVSVADPSISHSELTFPASALSPEIQLCSSSSSGNLFVDLFTEIIIELWIMNNFLVNYDDYPYAGEKYLCFDETDPNVYEANWYRFAADTSVYCYPGLYAGTEVRFEGLIWKFFGPILELDFSNMVDMNPSGGSFFKFQNPDFGLQLGLQMSIFQSNPLSLFWTIGWSMLKTSTYDVRYNGLFLQLIARSYPVKPLLIEWRGTLIDMSDPSDHDFMMFESHLEVGMMVAGPLEVFAAWRYLSSQNLRYIGHGFDLGVRYHL